MSELTLEGRVSQLECMIRIMANEETKLRERITDLENRPAQIERHYYSERGGLA